MKNILLIFGLLIIFQTANCQEVITDLLHKEGDLSSSPSDFVEFNQKLYFAAFTESNGREIWVTNGNENESYLLKDINPGKNSGIQTSLTETSVISNNTLYFIANDGISNGEIWKTDGTKDGTKKITTFLNSNISKLTLIGENFYFLIKNKDSLEVWISDGSEEGTKIVKENLPIWNTPSFQGKCNNNFIFTFQPYGSNNCRVWRSDGTTDGTYPLTDEIDGNGAGPNSGLSQYIEFNNELYFVSRYYLHKTDGTLANTVDIAALHSATTRLIDFADVIKTNGKLYFSFFEADYNRLFIWESDGTQSGSNKIYDESGSRYFMTSNLIGNDNSLIFCGVNNNGGTSLINLNLVDYSATYIKELQDSIEAPFIFSQYFDTCILKKINENKIFCSSPRGNYQRKGWISELTEETTNNVEVLDRVSNIFNFESSIYFSNYSESEGKELWKSDTNHENFQLLDNINKSKYGLYNESLQSLNSSLIFNANNGTIGDEIWNYNGTTSLLKDINKGKSSSNSTSFVDYNNEIYFVANDSIHGYEIWRTNGTAPGTEIVHDIIEGSGSSYPWFLTNHKGILFFIVYKDGHYHLCKSDGSNLEFIKDLGENDYGFAFEVKEMESSGNYLYFVTSAAGEDLWISDGTEAGTNKIKDLFSCKNLTDVNGKLFFTAYDLYKGETELWNTDGTETNTKLVKDIGLEYSSEPKDLFNFNGLLFFTAMTNESGRELWKSDGTENGTIQVVDINTGIQNAFLDVNFSILNNTLFFSANNSENGFELWKTDGSEIGTEMVKDINAGIESSIPSELVPINDLIYFQAYTAEHGSELWQTDGTESGTLMVADILPGNLNSNPYNITSVNNEVFFIAGTNSSGRQIWKVPYNTLNSVTEFFSETEITVHPNPSIDIIHFDTDSKIGSIAIYNSNGQLISIKKLVNNSINIAQLPSGLYIMRFDIGGKTINKKILKN
jgi:ELWxxDGT repeat protein